MRGKHKHSIAGFEAINQSGKRKSQCHLIYDLMKREPPLSDRQIASRLGLTPEATRKRVSDLVSDHVLVEDAEIKDSVTGLMVRTVRIANELDIQIAEQDEKIKAVTTVNLTKSRRVEIRCAAYMKSHSIPPNTRNVITTLEHLGLLK